MKSTFLTLSDFLWCRIIYLEGKVHLFGGGGTCAYGCRRSEESLRICFSDTTHFLFSWDRFLASRSGSLGVLSPSSQIQSAHHHTQLDSRNQNQIPKLSREAFYHLRNHPSTWVPFLQMLFSMIFKSEIISKILSPLESLSVHHRRAQSYCTQIKTHLTSGSLNAGPLDYATNTFIHRAIFPGLSGDF